MSDAKIAIIGLGYVGLPLARLFATRYYTVGFDINEARINELKLGVASTLEVEVELLQSVLTQDSKAEKGLFLTNQLEALKDCNKYIVTVTPKVDKKKR